MVHAHLQACDNCGQTLGPDNDHYHSTDVNISTTTYDEHGDITGTMEGLTFETATDYLVFCPDCTITIQHEWNNMLDRLKLNKS